MMTTQKLERKAAQLQKKMQCQIQAIHLKYQPLIKQINLIIEQKQMFSDSFDPMNQSERFRSIKSDQDSQKLLRKSEQESARYHRKKGRLISSSEYPYHHHHHHHHHSHNINQTESKFIKPRQITISTVLEAKEQQQEVKSRISSLSTPMNKIKGDQDDISEDENTPRFIDQSDIESLINAQDFQSDCDNLFNQGDQTFSPQYYKRLSLNLKNEANLKSDSSSIDMGLSKKRSYPFKIIQIQNEQLLESQQVSINKKNETLTEFNSFNQNNKESSKQKSNLKNYHQQINDTQQQEVDFNNDSIQSKIPGGVISMIKMADKMNESSFQGEFQGFLGVLAGQQSTNQFQTAPQKIGDINFQINNSLVQMGSRIEQQSPTNNNNYNVNNNNNSIIMFKDSLFEKGKILNGNKSMKAIDKTQSKKSLNRQMMKKLRLDLFQKQQEEVYRDEEGQDQSGDDCNIVNIGQLSTRIDSGIMSGQPGRKFTNNSSSYQNDVFHHNPATFRSME